MAKCNQLTPLAFKGLASHSTHYRWLHRESSQSLDCLPNQLLGSY